MEALLLLAAVQVLMRASLHPCFTAVPYTLLLAFLYTPHHVFQPRTASRRPLGTAAASFAVRKLQPAAALPQRHGSVPTSAAAVALIVLLLLQLDHWPPAVSVVAAIPACAVGTVAAAAAVCVAGLGLLGPCSGMLLGWW
jgi:hypothetical protein